MATRIKPGMTRWYRVLRNLAAISVIVIAEICIVRRVPHDLSIILYPWVFAQPMAVFIVSLIMPCHSNATIPSIRKILVYSLSPVFILFSLMCTLLAVTSTIYCSVNRRFQITINNADRVVIRDGGYAYDDDVDGQPILYTITNRAEIVEFNRMFEFSRIKSPCLCEGWPGIDWWNGDEKIAMTALKHCKALQWEGFSYGWQAMLFDKSKDEIREWLRRNNIGIE